MTVESLLKTCADLGIKLALKGDDDDRLQVDAPKGALTADLRDALAANKTALISALKTQRNVSQPAQAPASVPQTEAPVAQAPASSTSKSPEATSLILEHPITAPPVQLNPAEFEVSKLLSGSGYDTSVLEFQ